jgi:hypothetical protein
MLWPAQRKGLDRIQPAGASAVVPNGAVPDEWRQTGAPPALVQEASSAENSFIGELVAERPTSRHLARSPRASPMECLVLVSQSRSAAGGPRGNNQCCSSSRCLHLPHLFNPLTTAMSPLNYTSTRLQVVRCKAVGVLLTGASLALSSFVIRELCHSAIIPAYKRITAPPLQCVRSDSARSIGATCCLSLAGFPVHLERQQFRGGSRHRCGGWL